MSTPIFSFEYLFSAWLWGSVSVTAAAILFRLGERRFKWRGGRLIYLLLAIRLLLPLPAPWGVFPPMPLTFWIGTACLAGALCYFLLLTLRTMTCYRSAILNEQHLTDALFNEFLMACRRLRLGDRPKLMVTRGEQGALVMGVLRPLVIIPESLATTSAERLRHIAYHELHHYKKGDLIMNWIWSLAVSLHWINPLVRRMAGWNRLLNEMDCDERTCATLPDSEPALAYAQTLLSLADGSWSADGAAAIMESPSTLPERIEHLERLSDPTPPRRCGRFGYVATALLALAIFVPWLSLTQAAPIHPSLESLLTVALAIPGDTRADIPSKAQLDAAQKIIDEINRDDFSKYKNKKLAYADYAKKLNDLFAQVDDAPARFVLLEMLQQVYAENNDFAAALDILNKRAELFKVNLQNEQLTYFSNVLRNLRVVNHEQMGQFVVVYNRTMENAIKAKDYSMGDKLVTLARPYDNTLRKAREYNEFQKMATAVDDIRKKNERIVAVKAQLEKSPNDPTLNLEYADLLLASTRDWTKVLPFYAKAGDEFTAIVELQMTEFLRPEDHGKIADFWWKRAETEKDMEVKNVQQQLAVEIYADILPIYSGLKRQLIEKRIADFESENATPVSPRSLPTNLQAVRPLDGTETYSKVDSLKIIKVSNNADWWPGDPKRKLLNSNPHEFWNAMYKDFPVHVILRTDEPVMLSSIRLWQIPPYPSYGDTRTVARSKDFALYVSEDEVHWTKVAAGTLAYSSAMQEFLIPPQRAQYVKVEILSGYLPPDGGVRKGNASLARIALMQMDPPRPDGSIRIPDIKYTASSSYSDGHSPAKLNDENTHTWWTAKEVPFPHWVQMELPETMSLSEIRFQSRGNRGSNDTNAPKDFEVLVSSDGKFWRKILAGTLKQTAEPQAITLPKDTRGKFLQFKILSNFNSGHTSIAELHVYGIPTPAIRKKLLEESKKPIITVSSTHHDGRFKKEYLMDENSNTEWHSAEGDDAGFFTIDFKQPTSLRGLRIFPRYDMNDGRPHAYEIYASDNQMDWTKVCAGTLKDAAEFQSIQFPAPQNCRYIKFLSIDCYNGTEIKKRTVCISEVEFIR